MNAAIYNAAGIRVRHFKLSDQEVLIQAEDLTPGTYILRLQSKNQVYRRILIKY